MKKTSR